MTAEQDTYGGTPTPEWDEIRRKTAEWLAQRADDERSDKGGSDQEAK
jgi:hypothetical protein